jgi:hypothetical protein
MEAAVIGTIKCYCASDMIQKYNNSQQFPMNHDSEQKPISYERQSINNGVVNGKKGLGGKMHNS